jgi:CubicO group peptidase (beta-lactamase class C family)
VVMAWQDGAIDIDAPAAKYVPEFANNGKDKITIRQLLSHSAGIPVFPGLTGDTPEHWKASVAKVCEMPLQWEPGTRTQYHANTGMLISAEAVRRTTGGKTWHQICKERIFAPLGLDSFSFDMPGRDVPFVLIAPPEDISIGASHNHSNTGMPAAGCTGNITDLLKFLNFQTNGGVWKGKRLLQEKYWTAMHTVQYPGKPTPKAKAPGYDPWGFGMMLRGKGPGEGGLGWFGIRDQTSPTMFTHVGTSCVMAVGDPASEMEVAFFTTDVPSTKEKAGEMRNTVTNKIFGSLVG